MADSKDKDPLPASNTPLFAASEKIQKINDAFVSIIMVIIIYVVVHGNIIKMKVVHHLNLLQQNSIQAHVKKKWKLFGWKKKHYIKNLKMQGKKLVIYCYIVNRRKDV